MSGKIIKREDALALKPRTTTVHVPELGGTIILRRLSVADKLRMESPKEPQPDGEAAAAETINPAKLYDDLLLSVSLSAIDEDGKRLFPDVDDLRSLICDIETMKTLSAAIREINDPPKAGETEKNSEASRD